MDWETRKKSRDPSSQDREGGEKNKTFEKGETYLFRNFPGTTVRRETLNRQGQFYYSRDPTETGEVVLNNTT